MEKNAVYYQPETKTVHIQLTERVSAANVRGWTIEAHLNRTPFGNACLIAAEIHLKDREQPIQILSHQNSTATTALLTGHSINQSSVAVRAHKIDMPRVPSGCGALINNGDLPTFTIDIENKVIVTRSDWSKITFPEEHPIVQEMRDWSPVFVGNIENPTHRDAFNERLRWPSGTLDGNAIGQTLWNIVTLEFCNTYRETHRDEAVKLLLSALNSSKMEDGVRTVLADDKNSQASTLACYIAWRMLREWISRGHLSFTLPGSGNVQPDQVPEPESLLRLVYQLTNMWLTFEPYKNLAGQAKDALRTLQMGVGTTDLFAAFGGVESIKALPANEWAFPQLFLEGVHNQTFPVPDGLTIQLSDRAIREVKLWYDGHGFLLAALGFVLPEGGADLQYVWVGLHAVEDIVNVQVSFCHFNMDEEIDSPQVSLCAQLVTLVAAAFRDATVLEQVDSSSDSLNENKISALGVGVHQAAGIYYLARREYQIKEGWMARSSRTALRDAGVLRRITDVRGYFICYKHGQVPNKERMEQLHAAGLRIPNGKDDYRSGHKRLIFSSHEKILRSRSAFAMILNLEAKVVNAASIKDWRVAQMSVANMLEIRGLKTEVRYHRDKGIDLISVGKYRLVVQVKSKVRGIGPGDVRDFATAHREIEKSEGGSIALMVSTVGLPTAEALVWAKIHNIVCLHYKDLRAWLDKLLLA